MIPQMTIRRDKYHDVFTRESDKSFKVTSDKRVILGNKTKPYGYKGTPEETSFGTNRELWRGQEWRLKFEVKIIILSTYCKDLNKNEFY